MKPIAIFYHALFQLDGFVLPAAVDIVHAQMETLKSTGLLDASSEFIVGINGGEESKQISNLIIPSKASVVMHGPVCRNEVRSILMLEKWIAEHSEEAYILYFHSKGASAPANDDFRTRWRDCMMKHLITNWRQCVQDLETFESVGCHFMSPPATPPGQLIWAGTFFWARNSFLRTLPSIMERDRIKVSGIDSPESRWEPEVWIGNGDHPPKMKDYCPNWNPGKDHVA